jgi:hypothetical protein
MTTVTERARGAREKNGAKHEFVEGVHGTRYQTRDVARSVAFYTTHLGFTLKLQQLPAFANVSLGDVQILLAARKHPDPGQCPADSSRNRADGTGSCCGLRTFPRSSTR